MVKSRPWVKSKFSWSDAGGEGVVVHLEKICLRFHRFRDTCDIMPEEMEVKSNHLVISVLILLEELEDRVGVDLEDSCACF